MQCKVNLFGKSYETDLYKGIDLSIPLSDQQPQVNCYHANPVKFETYRVGDFVGSVAEGGPVNYQKVTLTPHGNGTHTECLGHITDSGLTINQTLTLFHFPALLISLTPEQQENSDWMITFSAFLEAIKDYQLPQALIVRTLPNGQEKRTKNYSGSNPPYFEGKIGTFIKKQGVEHFLTDLPSVDKEVDGGALQFHRTFWGLGGDRPREGATLTELIYVPNTLKDGYYLLNLQIISLELDASPSKPVLYPLLPSDRS